MGNAHVLTLREAAEQTGLGTEVILKIAADRGDVAVVADDATRIDPWALEAALADEGVKLAA